MAGYSGTPLAKKLGIKPGFVVRLTNAPADYFEWLAPMPADVQFSTTVRKDIDLWHAFVRSSRELAALLPKAMKRLRQDGCLWVSWPKKSSGVASDVTEDVIRDLALPLGLVDIKVCAVDETWSGLKLVIRKELRKS